MIVFNLPVFTLENVLNDSLLTLYPNSKNSMPKYHQCQPVSTLHSATGGEACVGEGRVETKPSGEEQAVVEAVIIKAGVREERGEAKATGEGTGVGGERDEAMAFGEVVDEWRSRGH